MKVKVMPSPVNLRQAVRNLNDLPAFPVIAQKLLALDLDSDRGEQQMLLLIGQDPLISARLIGLANSPLLGATRKIAAVKEAALMLGLNRVKSVATGIAVMSLVSRPPGRFDPQELWLHNMCVAFAMLPVVRAIPAARRPPDDLIFLAGMLHDIGYLVLAYLDPQRSDDLHTRLAIETDRPAIEVERELLEITHDELGAELASHWNLPEQLVAAIRCHHKLDAQDGGETIPLAHIIHLTEKLIFPNGLHEPVEHGIAAEEWIALGIAPAMAEEITAQAQEQAEQAVQFAAAT